MDWQSLLIEHWQVKLVCLTLIVAAYIDGKQLRVPNWITFPMILSGLCYHGITAGWTGLESALAGAAVGLLCLLPLYSIGGMGAGDVKLMAGIGAWMGASVTFWAFLVSAIVGGAMAIGMVLRRKSFAKHYANFWMLAFEFARVKNPRELSQIAAERKPQMLLLPYGIPICIGSIAYFLYSGMI
ncbi:MAG TPA: A24 family peptidase [Planctomycetaceae bacterium]|nr:A24 family peptidase [Planctomycetaceae bacterium]